MMRGFYNAAQAMLVKQRELDAISNNVANINTAGYRKDEIVVNSFQEELILVQGRHRVSGTFMQTYVDGTKANLEQSNFDFTESKFDVGIFGNVYFNIRTAGGDVLQTRNGQFELDNEGYLTLNKAGRVQGQNGDIYLGQDDFDIDPDGVIRQLPDMTPIDTLLLTYIPPTADVAKINDTLFRYDGGEVLPEGETFDVIHGAFEKSNVDANKEMTQAMEAQRLFEANSKILIHFDTMNAKSASIASLARY
ncbi:MAG: flagellar hook-basal body complex protein [Oscillospiraceae bacterium]|jgi:flagellar basal body rod protein FlgG|nr:flagellar hook-basal body complex protein [Oscillospiraceae bacterium]